jgi:hypothetical protein
LLAFLRQEQLVYICISSLYIPFHRGRALWRHTFCQLLARFGTLATCTNCYFASCSRY